MENATKALLIAAGVLIAILIISLGLVIFRMGSESLNNVNLSEAEIEAFNNKFKQYEGNNVRGSNVNALINTVFTNNNSQDDDSKRVSVKIGNTAVVNATKASSLSSSARADTGATYKVQCSYDTKTGLINSITVTKNS